MFLKHVAFCVSHKECIGWQGYRGNTQISFKCDQALKPFLIIAEICKQYNRNTMNIHKRTFLLFDDYEKSQIWLTFFFYRLSIKRGLFEVTDTLVLTFKLFVTSI